MIYAICIYWTMWSTGKSDKEILKCVWKLIHDYVGRGDIAYYSLQATLRRVFLYFPQKHWLYLKENAYETDQRNRDFLKGNN